MKSKTENAWYKEIGQRINSVRHTNNLTQEKMAEILKLSTTRQYQNIEYGKSRVAIEQLAILDEHFDASPEYILFGKVKSNKDYEYDFFARPEDEQLFIFLDIAKKAFRVHKNDFEKRMKDYCNEVLKGDT